MADRTWFSRLVRHPARKWRVYSYNPGAHTGPIIKKVQVLQRNHSEKLSVTVGVHCYRLDAVLVTQPMELEH